MLIKPSNPNRQRATFDMAMERTSIDGQVDHLIEELSELIQALMKARRHGHMYCRTDIVTSEMAHVLLSMDVLLYEWPSSKTMVSLEYNRKLDEWYAFECTKNNHRVHGTNEIQKNITET